MRIQSLIVGFVLALLVVPSAEARSYSYDTINFVFRINRDTTVDVTEYQEYRFVGEYHQGWRNIPKKKIDDLVVRGVMDKKTGVPLAYSPTRLEKTSPSSWGKYTTFFENGEYVIEWYYDARDEERGFELSYTLHGAVAFYDDHDEFYWNLFTGYDVPIDQVDAVVYLPEEVPAERLTAALYVHPLPADRENAKWFTEGMTPGPEYRFLSVFLPPGADMTIAPGWPKGMVDSEAYWSYWRERNWGYLGAVLVILGTLIALFLRWYFQERYRTGRGTIVPQYGPPQNLRPAMAELIVKERLSGKAWAATVIDLAVRGYVRIEKEEPSTWQKWARGVGVVGLAIWAAIWGGATWMFVVSRGSASLVDLPLMVAIVIFFIPLWPVAMKIYRRESIISEDYILHREGGSQETEASPLEDYERDFIDALFPSGRSNFFTRVARRSPEVGRMLYESLQRIKKKLQDETATDTGGYQRDFRYWRIVKVVLVVLLAIAIIFGFNVWKMQLMASGVIFTIVSACCFVLLIANIFFNPRLNRDGQVLREDWLGFKMYLETAERYRMQNLTPETFEKYLPYAIIFGVEQKWARAFEGLNMQNPSWYSGSGTSAGVFIAGGSGFSASAFSSSLSASFSSSFASSGGGGGASGGGGGAGGGGGGGGGGAS